MSKPQFPIYIISKGRHDCCLTANFFVEDGVDFKIVVEPQEKQLYADKYGVERILVLPFQNLGLGGIPARNWVWEHSKAAGAERHWIFDDNINMVRRLHKGKRIRCNTNIALKACEDFIVRYENIAIAGLNYTFFAVGKKPPFNLNNHVYSCLCIKNDLDYRWRGRYNEDTDLCLQVLSGGWCTVLFNVFLIDKMATMTMKGGNADVLYKGDGRLKMARSLERLWPGVVTVGRRFDRPQHKVNDEWKKFDTQLIRRKDLDWNEIEKTSYEIKLKQVKSEVKSEELKEMLKNAT